MNDSSIQSSAFGAPTGKWVKYIRTEDSPGHRELLVWSNENLTPAEEGPGWRAEVQCATIDRIPFRMKAVRLKKAYRPDIAQAVS
jgi:hypothetical protein